MFEREERVTDNRCAASAMPESRDALTAFAAPGADPRLVHQEKGRDVGLPKMGGACSQDSVGFHAPVLRMIDRRLAARSMPRDFSGTQQPHKTFARVLQQTRMDVESGASLADAMRKHPKPSNDLYTNMVARARRGGILDTILKRLATYIEKNVKSRARSRARWCIPSPFWSSRASSLTIILVEGHTDLASMFEAWARSCIADASRDLGCRTI